ncbi:MAG: InlB B-repeat-containing protein, partial [Christensenella sp.]
SLSVHDEMGKSGAGEYFALSNIYIDIEAKQGYRCKSLKVTGDSYVVTHDGQNLPSYILADSKNMNLSATFEHDPNSAFALTIQDVSNVGIITVSDDYGMSGAGTYYIGVPIHVDVKQTQQDVGIKAISVLSEYESGKTKTDSYKAYPFVFTPKSLENDKLKSVTIGAETEQLYYVTFESSEAAAGTVNNQNGYYSSSTGLEMNTRAAQGCYLSNYTVKNTDGTQYTTGNKRIYPTQDCAVTANFRHYTANIYTAVMGEGSVSGAGEYNLYTQAALNATPAQGYVFGGWYQDNKCVETTPILNINVTKDELFTAVFIPKDTCIVLFGTKDPQLGSVTCNDNAAGRVDAPIGSKVVMKAQPAQGCEFVKWQKNGKDIAESATFTADLTEISVEYTAFFAKTGSLITTRAMTNTGDVSSITVTPALDKESVKKGSDITVKATSTDPKMKFCGWFADGWIISYAETAVYTVKEDAILTAVYSTDGKIPVFVEYEPKEISKSEIKWAARNDIVTLTAPVFDGYSFSYWTNRDGYLREPNPNFNITVDKACNYVAVYKKNMVNVTYDLGSGNNANGAFLVNGSKQIVHNSNVSYQSGERVVAQAVAAPHYTTEAVYKNNELQVGDTVVFAAQNNDVIRASFKPILYGITINKDIAEGGNAYINQEKQSGFVYGETVNVYAQPFEKYAFDGWYDKDGKLLSAEQNYTVRVTGSMELIAKFHEKNPMLNVLVNPEKSGSVNIVSGAVPYGKQVSITATPEAVYQFVNWTDETGKAVSAENPIVFTAQRSRTLVANFAPKSATLTVTAEPSEGGSVSGGGSYIFGATANLTATPNAGYVFMGWMQDGKLLSVQKDYPMNVVSFEDVTGYFGKSGEHILIAAYSANKLAGNVSGSGIYKKGTNVTVTAVPQADKEFVGWYEQKTNTLVSTSEVYTFTADENRALRAEFKDRQYTITAAASPDTGGSVMGGGAYLADDKILLRAQANEGYAFLRWDLPNGATSTNAELAVVVSADAAYTAVFEPIKVQQNIIFRTNPQWGSIQTKIERNGQLVQDNQILYGDRVTYTAAVSPSHATARFESYQDKNGAVLSYDDVYVIEKVTNDIELSVDFVEPYDVAVSYSSVVNDKYNRQLLPGVQIDAKSGRVDGVFKTQKLVDYGAVDANVRFVGWYDNAGKLVNSSPSFTYDFTEPQELTARLEIKDIAVNLLEPVCSIKNYGQMVVLGNAYRDTGETVSIEARTDKNVYFKDWTVKDAQGKTKVLSTDQRYEYTVEAAAGTQVDIGSEYLPIQYYLKLMSSPDTAGKLFPQGYYAAGETVKVMAAPIDEKYSFSHYEDEDKNKIPMNQDYSCNVVMDGNKTVTAVFATGGSTDLLVKMLEAAIIGLSVYCATHGMIPISKELNELLILLRNGAEVTEIIQKLIKIIEKIVENLPEDPDNPPDDPSIAKVQVDGIPNPSAGGSVTGSQQTQVGNSVLLAAKVNAGYEFEKWSCNNPSIKIAAPQSITQTVLVTDEMAPKVEYTAHFKEKQTVVNFSASSGGTVSSEPATQGNVLRVNKGTSVTLTATPNAGYTLQNWVKDGVVLTTEKADTYTFTADTDVCISANFVKPVNVT